jgi:UDPglucose 6-dehydrogenase
MKVAIVGTGYVGLVTGACLAHLGHHVICLDVVEAKVRSIDQGKVPFFEPGLEDLLKEGLVSGRLRATTDHAHLDQAEVIFLCVGTPSRRDGSLDLRYIKQATVDLGRSLSKYDGRPVIVIKSTVMPRTTEDVVLPLLEKTIGRKAGPGFGLAMNPEFLKEGAAVHDFLHPDRIVIGGIDQSSIEKVRQLYSSFDCPIMQVPLSTAEMIKVASNAFLATKISFVNEVGNICKGMGIDFRQVAEGMGHDARIGRLFLRAGCGYGGSCFPKDLRGLLAESRRYDEDAVLLKAVQKVNQRQPARLVRILERHMDLEGKNIAVLGLAFKPDTDDVRDASAQKIVELLLRKKANIRAYDPKAMSNFRKIFPQIDYCQDARDCVTGTDAVLIVTEWKEFSDPDLFGDRLVVDGRGVVRTKNYEGICW